VNGLLEFAKKHRLHSKTLDLKNSGDSAGDKNRVVGYGAYAFY
ncbi:MAG TPA: AmmeMemoRadiSam system protein B, partial [Gammaproteobacteria bacterium]|nr:AmmeMemoRadiSam system protein B [Gammaproteobacteria bacterium]